MFGSPKQRERLLLWILSSTLAQLVELISDGALLLFVCLFVSRVDGFGMPTLQFTEFKLVVVKSS